MPELRDLMANASEGPGKPVDVNEVWRLGARRRWMKRAVLAVPIVAVLVLAGSALAVVADNDAPESGFVGLTPEQTAIVDRYLVSLEASGQRAAFTDDRAAVEYAWRVECFGDISPIELKALGTATIDLVGAISAEATVSSAVAAEVATTDELDTARATTDEARAAYARFVDSDYLSGSSEPVVNARQVVATRLEDYDFVREAVDGRQMSVLNWTNQFGEVSGAAVDYLTEASLVSIDADYIREWDRTHELLELQIATANLAGGTLGISVDTDGRHDLDALGQLINEEDVLLADWERDASPEAKSQLREQTSTEEVRRYENTLNEALLLLESLDAETTTAADFVTANQNPRFAADMLARGRALSEVYGGLHELTGLPASPDAADVALTEAVDRACAATNDEILAVEPSLMADSADDGVTPTTASLSTEAPATTAASALVTSPPDALATTTEQPATTSEPATAPTAEAPDSTATTAVPVSQPDVSEPVELP